MIRYAVQAQRIAALRAAATPQQSGDLEATPWQLFHTQTYTSASTVRQVFFSTAPTSVNNGNMDAAGMLTAPNWFSIACHGFDINQASAAATGDNTGELNDVALLSLKAQSVWTLTISGKKYGQFRVSPIHGTGYAAGQIAIGATVTDVQLGNFGPVGDGGWYWDHAVIIPPNVGFNIEVVYASAQTLASSNSDLTWSMFGTLFRRVL